MLDIDSVQMNIVLVSALVQNVVRYLHVFISRVWSYFHTFLTRDVLTHLRLFFLCSGFFECIDLFDYSIPSNLCCSTCYPFSPAVFNNIFVGYGLDSNSRAIQPRFKLHGIRSGSNLSFVTTVCLMLMIGQFISIGKAIKLICFQ